MQAAEINHVQGNSKGMAAWVNRPGDHSFDAIDEVLEHTMKMKDKSFIKESALEHLGVMTTGNSLTPGVDDLYVTKDGTGARFNNHSFNQFCSIIGARASEWHKFPAALAQVPLTWLVQNGERKDVKLLLSKLDNGKVECRAVNSSSYGRIWNHDLVKAVKDHIDPTVWKVPQDITFHLKKGFITCNDRKVFIFLVNEANPILVEGLQPLYRGFYAWNSEVGDGTCGIAEFLLNKVCANRAMVGVTDFQELNIRHTSGAPDRWVRDAVPSLHDYVNASTAHMAELLQASRTKKVAKDEKGALEWLQNRGFTHALAKSALESAREESRGADPTSSPYSVWNIIQGLTAEAREKMNNDDRVEIERHAGKLMKVVA
jgi:hypothetical protein